MGYSLRRRGRPRHLLPRLVLAVSAREGGSLEVFLTPSDVCQQLVRSFTDCNFVLLNEIAMDAEGAAGGL